MLMMAPLPSGEPIRLRRERGCCGLWRFFKQFDKSITCNENGYINLFMMWLCLWIFMSLLREKFGALRGDIGKKKRRLSM